MSKKNYKILTSGDSCITVTFGDKIDENINSTVVGLVKVLKESKILGIEEIIPAFTSLCVIYNPLIISYTEICKLIKKKIAKIKINKSEERKVFVIPVCYDKSFALDLDDVCEHTALSNNEVIKLHTAPDYLIYMLGFLPGFAYLGGLDKRLVTPRLETPRKVIEAGSVGIGGEQTGIYPLMSPGGWRLIGKTPVKPYDPNRENAFLYQAGDYIRFKEISLEEFNEIKDKVNSNTYECEIIEVAK